MVDEEAISEVTVNEGEDVEEEEENLTDSSGESSSSHSEDGDEEEEEEERGEGSDVDNEIDEEFRKEIKMALGDAALASSEVCYYLQILIDLATMLNQLCKVRLISLVAGNYGSQLEGITLVVFHFICSILIGYFSTLDSLLFLTLLAV